MQQSTRGPEHFAFVETKRCPGCGKVKSLSDFYKNTVRHDGVAPYCIPCNKNRNEERARRLRAELLAYLGNACRRCGFDNPLALQVDHVNGGGSIERRSGAYGWGPRSLLNRVRATPELFQLLCANCNIIKRFETGEHVGARQYTRVVVTQRPAKSSAERLF